MSKLSSLSSKHVKKVPLSELWFSQPRQEQTLEPRFQRLPILTISFVILLAITMLSMFLMLVAVGLDGVGAEMTMAEMLPYYSVTAILFLVSAAFGFWLLALASELKHQ